MRTSVLPFLCLGLLLLPDSAAVGNVSTDNSHSQGLVSLVVTQALQMQQLSNQVLRQGSQLQQQASQLQQQSSQLQQQSSQLQQQSSQLQQQSSQLQQQSSQLQQQSSQLQQLRSLQKKVVSMGSELEWHTATLLALNNSRSRQAAFSVRYPGRNIINVGVEGTLKYQQIITNIGGGYSTVTGHFTAPYTGVYAFFTSLRSSNNHPWVLLAIFKGAQSLMEVTADGNGDAWDRGTAFVTTHMNKGEIAYVRHTGSSAFLEAGHYTTFSGMLVAAD